MSKFTTYNNRYRSNFLGGIKLNGKIVLPTDQPQRSIFKIFMLEMSKKVQSGEWTKKEFNDWKSTLTRVDEDILCREPNVFLHAVKNSPEINRKIVVLARSLNLKNVTGELTSSDIAFIAKGVESYSIIDVLRDVTTKGYQVTSKLMAESFDNCGLDELEIMLEQLKDEDDNILKSRLRQEFDNNFKFLRCVAGIDRLVSVSEERLIPRAIDVVSGRIRSEYEKMNREIEDYQNSSSRAYVKKVYFTYPWNDSSNR